MKCVAEILNVKVTIVTRCLIAVALLVVVILPADLRAGYEVTAALDRSEFSVLLS